MAAGAGDCVDVVLVVACSGMSHNPSCVFRSPCRRTLPSLTAVRLCLLSTTVQSSSHNWPKEIRLALFSAGRIKACFPAGEILEDKGSWPVPTDGRAVLSG